MAHYGAKGRNSESASGFKPAMEHATSEILTLVSYDFQKKNQHHPRLCRIAVFLIQTNVSLKVKEKHKKKVKE